MLNSTSNFIVYNASAGSGKTYALVKNYLQTILSYPGGDGYKHLLAITFTNKAVAEMKDRIINHLTEFASFKTGDRIGSMHNDLCQEMGKNPEQLGVKSAIILKSILHNYAGFSVETIDSFNHRLLRTFAKDLGLNSNFEVSLDVDLLLQEAVDQILAQAGTDPELTKTLIDFALYKAEQDKSWDISFDLFNMATILKNESDYQRVMQLSQTSKEAFKCLEEQLNSEIKRNTGIITQSAKHVLDLLDEQGIAHGSFSRKTIPNFFINAMADKLPGEWSAVWMTTLGQKAPYTQKTPEDQKAAIDGILEHIITAFNAIKEAGLKNQFAKMLLNKLTPHALLSHIYASFEAVKTAQNVLPISAFNKRIHQEIKDQPAPFIYERMGEWYRHYFIDEFQDTSSMQWQNLEPLIANALSQQYDSGTQGSLLLVGDAKQSIYRWRGGEPEQFMQLSQGASDFPIPAHLVNLKTNYRSHKEIIGFNNAFFTYAAKYLEQQAYCDLYLQDSKQLFNTRDKGYVQIDFVPPGDKSQKEEAYVALSVTYVKQAIDQGYSLSDICILAPKKDQISAVAQALNQEGIPFVSAESVLLKNAAIVQLLIALIRLNNAPTNKELQLEFYSILQVQCLSGLELHHVLVTALYSFNSDLTATMQHFGFDFSQDTLNSLGLYDALEYCIRNLKIEEKCTAYERFLLNHAHDFEQQQEASFNSFLAYWDKKADSLSVQFPEGMNAVQLMTIHKAKGLEFPVLIFPFADSEFIKTHNQTVWFPLDPDRYCGFNEFELPFSKKLAQINQVGEHLYNKVANQQYFDRLNVLYVALTRAANQLFIITTAKEPGSKDFGGLFCDYLNSIGLWNSAQTQYSFGSPTPAPPAALEQQSNKELPFITTAKETHSIQLVAAPTKTVFDNDYKARIQGQRLHDLLAQINTLDDLNPLFNRLEALGLTSTNQLEQDKAQIFKVLTHPDLQPYFAANITVKNEADLIDDQGNLHRPDRLCFHPDGSISILDYKFGQQDSSYRNQLDTYASVLTSMGFVVFKKILVYCNQEIVLDTW